MTVDRIGKFVIAAGVGTLMGAAPALAADPNLNLKMNGDGDWMVSCSAETVRGRSSQDDARPRGKRDYGSVFLRGVVSGECNYEAGSGSLTITMEEGDLGCPFDSDAADRCMMRVAAGEEGSFSFAVQ